jgi:hypothetical protein
MASKRLSSRASTQVGLSVVCCIGVGGVAVAEAEPGPRVGLMCS